MFLFASCSSGKKESSEKSNNQKSDSTYTVKVISNDKTLKEYKIEDIQKMPQTTVKIEGKDETGVKVNDLLKDAGVTSYSKLTLKDIYDKTYEVAKDKIDDETVFDISNRGTIKIASKLIPKADWAKDIKEIVVGE
jgi:hypothetical protein